MADAVMGNTQLGASKAAIIAELVQRELKAAALLMPTVTDVSVFAKPGAKSISFPKLGSFTVTERTNGAAGDATTVSDALDTLNLDINAYLAYIVDSVEDIQANPAVLKALNSRAAAAHARYVDTKIMAELNTVGVVVGASDDITKNIFLDMREALLSRHAIPQDLTFLVSVDQEKALLKIDEFTRADIYGGNVIASGILGHLYGVPVLRHAGAAAKTAILYEKSSIAVGFQKRPNMSTQGANEYGATAVRTAIDQLFGVKGQQIAQAGVASGKSALVVVKGPSA